MVDDYSVRKIILDGYFLSRLSFRAFVQNILCFKKGFLDKEFFFSENIVVGEFYIKYGDS